MQDDTLKVVAIGKEITDAQIAEARARMHFYGLEEVELMVIQADNAADLVLTTTLSSAEQANAVLSNQVADLQRQLAAMAAIDSMSQKVSRMAGPAFPTVYSIAVGKLGGVMTAVVTPQEGCSFDEDTRHRLNEWLRLTIESDSLDIVYRQNEDPIEPSE